jgi:cytoskeletal protein CcmA (bactofilin family)
LNLFVPVWLFFTIYETMFNKQTDKEDFKDAETIIGPSIKVTGDFHGDGNIIIEGIVEGSVKTSNSLLAGEKSKITANIEAGEAKIGGEVSGNIKIMGYLEITDSAVITGDIEAEMVSIARGAVFNGKCTMNRTKGKRGIETSVSE